MDKIKVALIYGGDSSEREVSLKGGNAFKQAIDSSKYELFTYDPAYDIKKIVDDSDKIDTAFILLHGKNGEDGRIQGLLDLLNIPYQCSGVLASALAMNKAKCKDFYKINSIPVAEHLVFSSYTQDLEDLIIQKTGLPAVIKPGIGGSSIALSIVEKKEDIKNAAFSALKESEFVLAEKFIQGTEITCAVIGNNKPEALPLIEICPGKKHKLFDYEAKYKPGETEEICPARIDEKTRSLIQELCIKIHCLLGCKGYSRTDLIIENDKIYVLETNTIPGMTETSLLPLAAKAAGISFAGLIDRLLTLSMEK
ncbi:MAG: D-alanine--D-alanine ligase [Deltaproteobacteria bacterium]|nr:MAG: D-alanine--D-alanine ligase [Deltaproteobacteria bacterium]